MYQYKKIPINKKKQAFEYKKTRLGILELDWKQYNHIEILWSELNIIIRMKVLELDWRC